EGSPAISTRSANLPLTALDEAQTPPDPWSWEAGAQQFTSTTQTKSFETAWLNIAVDGTAADWRICVACGGGPDSARKVITSQARTPARSRLQHSALGWRGSKGSLHVYLEPGLVGRVAAEAFDLDPARWVLPLLDSLDIPHMRAAMAAVDAELAA